MAHAKTIHFNELNAVAAHFTLFRLDLQASRRDNSGCPRRNKQCPCRCRSGYPRRVGTILLVGGNDADHIHRFQLSVATIFSKDSGVT